MRKQPEERTYGDPVCGMEISRKTAADECTHLGKSYYFCSPGCRAEFESNPDRYLPHHRQHGAPRG